MSFLHLLQGNLEREEGITEEIEGFMSLGSDVPSSYS
jgi:hypothetical protein